MSNQLEIEVIQYNVVGSLQTYYGVIAKDNYASAYDLGYAHLSDFHQQYPTRLSILEWIHGKDAFEGSFFLHKNAHGTKVEFDAVSSIYFAGFDDDGSVEGLEND